MVGPSSSERSTGTQHAAVSTRHGSPQNQPPGHQPESGKVSTPPRVHHAAPQTMQVPKAQKKLVAFRMLPRTDGGESSARREKGAMVPPSPSPSTACQASSALNEGATAVPTPPVRMMDTLRSVAGIRPMPSASSPKIGAAM